MSIQTNQTPKQQQAKQTIQNTKTPKLHQAKGKEKKYTRPAKPQQSSTASARTYLTAAKHTAKRHTPQNTTGCSPQTHTVPKHTYKYKLLYNF
jgi:hypothetical protein